MQAVKDIFLLIITYMPGTTGFRLRYHYYKKKMKYLASDAVLDVGVQIYNPESITIGSNTHIDRFVMLLAGKPDSIDSREIKDLNNHDFKYKKGELIIGNNCHIAPGCLISAIGGIHIGNGVNIAASTKIYSFTHHYRSFQNPFDKRIVFGNRVPNELQTLIRGPIVIKDNVGIAVNCVVLPGITLEKESFVGIGSVVNRNVLSNRVVSGNPAKFIAKRFREK